ncbi:GntR family transcriptional regulator [Flavobacterium limnophilum]|uniref:GntR family transcriptional regulator n=1 Tax=Flavobacterium limnophilum TaxID=3003262 RepID=UPI0022ABE90F|nr:GntR family transcriptional regulator [Flavobacterium limnophilum]
MDFKSTKGIYLQIVDNLCRQILEGQLQTGDRVASVRDLAAEFEVNHNTVMRAYTNLQESGIFDNKRGIGFFVSEKALELIQANEKDNFFSQDLPDFLLKVKLLQLNSTDLTELLSVIKNNDNENQ